MKQQTSRYQRFYRKISDVTTKPRNRAYTMIILSLFALSLFGWFAIRPTLQTIFYLRREIADKTILNRRMGEKISDLIRAQADYNSLRTKFPLLEEAVPSNPKALSYVAQLRNIESSSGMKIISLQFADVPVVKDSTTSMQVQLDQTVSDPTNQKSEAESSPIKSFPVSAVLSGSYGSLRTYLSKLADARRISSIEALGINAGGGSDQRSASPGGQLLEVAIQLMTYYKKDN